MYCVSVDFSVHKADFAAFVSRTCRQATDSLALEPGCRVFEVWTGDDRPGQVHLHEIYDDAAAFALHLASAHFRAFEAETSGMVLAKSVSLWNRQA